MKYWWLTLLFTVVTVSAQSSWKIVDAKASFTIKNAGLEAGGSFDKPAIELVWDIKNPKMQKLQVLCLLTPSTQA